MNFPIKFDLEKWYDMPIDWLMKNDLNSCFFVTNMYTKYVVRTTISTIVANEIYTLWDTIILNQRKCCIESLISPEKEAENEHHIIPLPASCWLIFTKSGLITNTYILTVQKTKVLYRMSFFLPSKYAHCLNWIHLNVQIINK